MRADQIEAVLWYSIPELGWVNNAIDGASHNWIIPLAATLLMLYALYLFAMHFVQRGCAKRRGAAT